MTGDVDPVSVRITARADQRSEYGVQVVYCHAACLEVAGFGNDVTERDYWSRADENEADEDALHEFDDEAWEGSVPFDEFPIHAQLAFLQNDFPSNYIDFGRRVSCWLCEQEVLTGDIDPVTLRITARADRRYDHGAQVVHAHAACLAGTGFGNLEVTDPAYWSGGEADTETL